MTKKLKLTDTRNTFKPFSYPKCYELWKKHEQIHWLPNVVNMQQDIKDFKTRLTPSQKNFLTQILRLFTQGDIDVAAGYVNNYLPVFPQPEVRMMLLGFAARECVHIDAYSHLLETLGFPDTTYNEFLKYKEMADKHDFIEQITANKNPNQVVQHMCAISAFTEGMQLFSTFVMMMNFGRNNLMPGMTKINTWSLIDESCLVPETEVLTSGGWKRIDQVQLIDSVCQFDMETQQTSFVSPTGIVRKSVDKIYQFESDSISQHTSKDHRMILDLDGKIVETTAEKYTASPDLSFVLSGEKVGSIKTLTEKHKELIELSKSGELDLSEWVVDLIPEIDSSWCKEFLEAWSK